MTVAASSSVCTQGRLTLVLERTMMKMSQAASPSSSLARSESPGLISHLSNDASTPFARRSVASRSTNALSTVAWLMNALGLGGEAMLVFRAYDRIGEVVCHPCDHFFMIQDPTVTPQ